MSVKKGKDALLLWCKKTAGTYPGIEVTNFHTSWRDGRAFVALIHKNRPDLVPDPTTLSPANALSNLTLAFDVATKLGIPQLLDPEDMLVGSQPEQFSVITYLSYWYDAFARSQTAATESPSPAARPAVSAAPAPAPAATKVSPSVTPTPKPVISEPAKPTPAVAQAAKPSPATTTTTTKPAVSEPSKTASTNVSKPAEPAKPAAAVTKPDPAPSPAATASTTTKPAASAEKTPATQIATLASTGSKTQSEPTKTVQQTPAAATPPVAEPAKPTATSKPEPKKPETDATRTQVTPKEQPATMPTTRVTAAPEPVKPKVEPVAVPKREDPKPTPVANPPVELNPNPSKVEPKLTPAAATSTPTATTTAAPKRSKPKLPPWVDLKRETILGLAFNRLPLSSLFRISLCSKSWRKTFWSQLESIQLDWSPRPVVNSTRIAIFDMGHESADTLRKLKDQCWSGAPAVPSLPSASSFDAFDKISRQLASLRSVDAYDTFIGDDTTRFSKLIQSMCATKIQRISLSTQTIPAATIQEILKSNTATLVQLRLVCTEADDSLSDSISSLTHLADLSLYFEEDGKVDLKWLKAIPTSVTHLRLQGKLTERVSRHLRTQMAHLKHVELDYAFWHSKFSLIRAKDINLSKIKEVMAENLPSGSLEVFTPSIIFAAVEAVGLRGAPKLICDIPVTLMPQIGYSMTSMLLLRFGLRSWKPILEAAAESSSIWARPELLDSTGFNLFHLASCSALQDYFVVEKLFSPELLQPSYARNRRCLQDSRNRNPIMLSCYDPEGSNATENLAIFKTVAHSITYANYASVDDADAFGDTVLHHVIRGSSSDTLGVKLSILAALGINWNTTNNNGQSATHIASTEALQELLWAKSPDLSQNLDLNWPFKNGLLFRACAENLLSVVSLLLLPQFSSWIDWECTIPKGRSESWIKANCVEAGETFLQIACESSSAAVIRLLLNAYAGKTPVAEFYAKNFPADRQPLFLVCTAARRRTKLQIPENDPSQLPSFVYEANDIRKISLLIEHGFTAESDLVFHALVGSGGDVSKCIVRPDLDTPTIHRTLQRLFLTQPESKLIEFFVNFASEECLNSPDETDNNRTILHQFIELAPSPPTARTEEIIRLLLGNGASLLIADSEGQTPLSAASKKKFSSPTSSNIQEAAKLQQSKNPQQSGSCAVM